MTLGSGGLFGSAAPFHIGASDLFKLVDPDAYRTLTWADLRRLLIKLFGTSLVMWVYFAMSIKRLHDRNKSAWWIVPFLVAPGLNTQFGDWLGDSWPAVFICYAAHIAFIWGFVEMYCLKGTSGPNRFGPDPVVEG